MDVDGCGWLVGWMERGKVGQQGKEANVPTGACFKFNKEQAGSRTQGEGVCPHCPAMASICHGSTLLFPFVSVLFLSAVHETRHIGSDVAHNNPIIVAKDGLSNCRILVACNFLCARYIVNTRRPQLPTRAYFCLV